jgi:hypothetical protein
MVGDHEDPDLLQLEDLVEELGLSALGYRAAFKRESSGRVTVRFEHPLLLDNQWSVTKDPSRPDWQSWVRDRILSWPDLALVREAVIRAESVPIVAALRNGAIIGCLGQSAEASEGAVRAIALAGRALAAASVLTDEEVDWLDRALDADQEWLR